MPQRLDDVTGKAIVPMSAKQRERQREAMLAHLNELTVRVNDIGNTISGLKIRYRPEIDVYTTEMQEMQSGRINRAEEETASLKALAEQAKRQAVHAQMDTQMLTIRLAEQGVFWYQIQTDTWHSPAVTRARSFWQRLRWLVTGR